jgi:hypothetical protein
LSEKTRLTKVWALVALAATAVLPAFALTGRVGAQNDAPPPCALGVAPAATIHGFDVEDGGGALTATHTIALEARGRDGVVPGVTFSLPSRVEVRGTQDNPAFSVDTAGPVPVTATWLHYDDDAGSDCTASAQGTLKLRSARALTFTGLPLGTSISDAYQTAMRAGRNADLRPVEFRLRGVRRARLPGLGARLQTITLALRRGDAGLSMARSRRLRAAGWRFVIGNVDGHLIVIDAKNVEARRGRRGGARGFGYSFQLVQAGDRVGRIRVTGRCGYLGCHWRSLR